VVGLFYLLLQPCFSFNATLLHYAHCLLLLHLSPPTVTNAPQRDRSIMDIPSINNDDNDNNNEASSILAFPHETATHQAPAPRLPPLKLPTLMVSPLLIPEREECATLGIDIVELMLFLPPPLPTPPTPVTPQ